MDAACLIKTFFETFDGGAKEELAAFVARHPACGPWLIAADYVVNDRSRPSDVFAFSICPNSEGLPALRDRIQRALPSDIKRMRVLNEAALAALKSSDVYHIAVMLPKNRMLLGKTGMESISNARLIADKLLGMAIQQDWGERDIAVLRKVREYTTKKTFSHRLLSDVLLLSLLLPAITIALMRETLSRNIVWMSDRDKMTQWCNGAVWSLAQLNLREMGEKMAVELGVNGPAVCVPSTKGMWFDDVIRLPDFIAGALATWNCKAEHYASETKIELFSDVYRKVIAEAENLAVLKLRTDARGVGWSRVIFKNR